MMYAEALRWVLEDRVLPLDVRVQISLSLSSLASQATPLSCLPAAYLRASANERQGDVEDRQYPWVRAPGDGFAVILRHN